MDEKQLLETWEIHNRINLYLLDAVEPAALVSLSASKGRTVGTHPQCTTHVAQIGGSRAADGVDENREGAGGRQETATKMPGGIRANVQVSAE